MDSYSDRSSTAVERRYRTRSWTAEGSSWNWEDTGQSGTALGRLVAVELVRKELNRTAVDCLEAAAAVAV